MSPEKVRYRARDDYYHHRRHRIAIYVSNDNVGIEKYNIVIIVNRVAVTPRGYAGNG